MPFCWRSILPQRYIEQLAADLVVRRLKHTVRGKIKTLVQENRRFFPTLLHMQSIHIQRHVKIRATANPYALSDEQYFESRLDRKMKAAMTKKLRAMWMRQNGICPECGLAITTETGWNNHYLVKKVFGGSDKPGNLVMLHPRCHSKLHSHDSAGSAQEA